MFKKKLLLLIAISTISLNLIAGGEPVNCREETVGQQAIYQGYAECSVNVNTGERFTQREILSGFVQATTRPTVVLAGFFYNQYYSCTARVPFHTYAELTEEVCDYLPGVKITVDQFSYGEIYIDVQGWDSDGTIVKWELFIDGVLQSQSDVMLHGDIGQTYLVRGTVTDDDGYTTTTLQYVTIEYVDSINPF